MFRNAGQHQSDPGRNGGVTIKGWLRNDVLIRSRVDVWADSDADANALISQIRVDTSNGTVSTTGPNDTGRGGWSVSYEIFVPRASAVDAMAHNGGVHVSDVDGAIHLDTTNGGIHLESDRRRRERHDEERGSPAWNSRGAKWEGRQLDPSTRNGSITVSMPGSYSAHVQAETVHGGIYTDFPVTVTGRIRRQDFDGNIGSGGPLIHVSTGNFKRIIVRASCFREAEFR